MPTPALSEDLKLRIAEYSRSMTQDQVAAALGVAGGTVSKYRNYCPAEPPSSDKKVGEFNLDEWLDWMESGQKLRKKASYSQHASSITLTENKNSPQIVCPQGDWHIASWGTDHSMVRDAINTICATENAWFPLMGDLAQMSIKLRSVLEVSDNLLPPEMQMEFLEQLLEKIMHRVPFSVWCNHGVEREEKQSGISMVKHILSRRTVYFNGIGHPDIRVGDETYKFAASHKYRGNSMYDSTFGNRRYARMEANDREVILQADLHRPAFGTYYEGGMKRTVITCGTFQTSSGYAQRYFSLKTWPVMPCVVLHGDRHLVVPFENLAQALEYLGRSSGAA